MAVPVGLFARSQHNSDDTKPTKETKHWSSFLRDRDHIQVLRLYGAIEDNEDKGFLPDTETAPYVRRKLTKALDDKNVKGILLRINSPGGTVGMSQEVYDVVKQLRAKNKPVVISMGDVAASGGYYIASAGDRIFANPGTLTGSIGVIMHLLNWQETEKKIGLQPFVIKSGAFKDIGSADRPMTPDEKNLLQAIIMDSYDQFVTAVSDGRKMDKEAVKKLADGRIYSGRQAYKAKLVDELGGYEDALAYLQKDCKKRFNLKEDLPVDDGSSSFSLISQLFSGGGGGGSSSRMSGNGLGASFLKGLLPTSMDPKWNKMPLWIME
jgi:protease-4